MICQKLKVTFSEGDLYKVAFATDNDLHVDMSDMHSAGTYEGTYEVTPNLQTQTLQTTNKTLTQNVVVHPIPNNYGLITWNGTILSIT